MMNIAGAIGPVAFKNKESSQFMHLGKIRGIRQARLLDVFHII